MLKIIKQAATSSSGLFPQKMGEGKALGMRLNKLFPKYLKKVKKFGLAEVLTG